MSQQELELPQGWVETILGDIAIRLQAGGTPSTKNSWYYENGIIPFVKIDDITDSNSKYLKTTKVKITNQGLNDSSAWLVSENSLLYSMYASYGLPIINKIKVATSQAIIVYQQPKDLISLEFLYYFLKFMGPFSATKGTTQKNLNAGIVRNYKILLPPLNEQKRIVSKIEELFSKVDSTKQSLEQTKLQLEQYKSSLLKYAFEGKLTKIQIEHQMKCKTVKDYIKIQNGYAFKSIWFKDKGIRLLRNINMGHGKINWDKTVFLDEKKSKQFSKFQLSENDIVISMDRPIISSGLKLVKLKKNDIPALLLQRVGKFKILNKNLDTDFLYLWLQSFYFLRSLNPGRSIGVPHVSSTELENIEFKIPIPSLCEQQEIVSQIEQGFSLIENTTQIVESTLQKLQTMKISVLKQAIEGKLVPQDPNDEPASVLLEKIKSTKESQSTKQRRMKNVK